jgi:Uma2 family endonuclease
MSEGAIRFDGFDQDLRDVADRLLEATRVEYVDEGVLLIMNPPGIEHRRIVRSIVKRAQQAFDAGLLDINWETYETYQWDIPDDKARRFYIPDIVFVHPDAVTAEEERAAIALIVEVTFSRRRSDSASRLTIGHAGFPDRRQVAVFISS